MLLILSPKQSVKKNKGVEQHYHEWGEKNGVKVWHTRSTWINASVKRRTLFCAHFALTICWNWYAKGKQSNGSSLSISIPAKPIFL